jgi:hypothetical protein
MRTRAARAWIQDERRTYCPIVELMPEAPRVPHKTVVLRGGPLDGEPVCLPPHAISMVVFSDGEFHRYSVAASSGEIGEQAPLGYTGTVPVEVAGFTPTLGDHTQWILPEG